MSGRIYSNVHEAIEEVQRELFEMGIDVKGYSYQDKIVEGDEAFTTKELQAYSFTITTPRLTEALRTVHEWYGEKVHNWVLDEIAERVGFSTHGLNPGLAWCGRKEVWEQFLEADGKFAYTYSERMAPQLNVIIHELKRHPQSRQAIVSIHNSILDLESLGGKRRIPCSMFYHFLIRRGAMDCIYTMRSSDFLTHFVNDVVLAILLQDWVRRAVDPGLKMGDFHMFVSSLHAFKKDMDAKGIF